MSTPETNIKNDKYSCFFEKSIDAMLIIEEYKFIDCNKAAIQMLQYNREDIINANPADLSPEYQPDGKKSDIKAKEVIDNVYENGAQIFEWMHKKKNGEEFPVEVSLTPIPTGNKKMLHTIWRDISARKNAEKERNRLKEELHLSQKMEAIGLMAGGVAHDLNNILSGIVTYPEVLMYNLSSDSQLYKPLKMIMESGKRAAAIVADLLTVARGVAATRKICELNKLITDLLISPDQINLKKENPNITFNTNLTSEVLMINCSTIHVNKSIINLLVNAFEAVNNNGIIDIITERKYLHKPVKGYNNIRNGYYAILRIKDNGIGISSTDLERIFEPFYTKKFLGRNGTGLGLTIVWNTVEEHDGYIEVSTDHSGTTFSLYFPTADNLNSDQTDEGIISNYTGNKENILIVDDELMQRDLLCSILSLLNYSPVAVTNGEEAIEYLKDNPIELIILDMILGKGLNGKETYEEIIKFLPMQKAIIVSGYSKNSDVLEAQSLGVGNYISKPYNIQTIGKIIQETLFGSTS